MNITRMQESYAADQLKLRTKFEKAKAKKRNRFLSKLRSLLTLTSRRIDANFAAVTELEAQNVELSGVATSLQSALDDVKIEIRK